MSNVVEKLMDITLHPKRVLSTDTVESFGEARLLALSAQQIPRDLSKLYQLAREKGMTDVQDTAKAVFGIVVASGFKLDISRDPNAHHLVYDDDSPKPSGVAYDLYNASSSGLFSNDEPFSPFRANDHNNTLALLHRGIKQFGLPIEVHLKESEKIRGRILNNVEKEALNSPYLRGITQYPLRTRSGLLDHDYSLLGEFELYPDKGMTDAARDLHIKITRLNGVYRNPLVRYRDSLLTIDGIPPIKKDEVDRIPEYDLLLNPHIRAYYDQHHPQFDQMVYDHINSQDNIVPCAVVRNLKAIHGEFSDPLIDKFVSRKDIDTEFIQDALYAYSGPTDGLWEKFIKNNKLADIRKSHRVFDVSKIADGDLRHAIIRQIIDPKIYQHFEYFTDINKRTQIDRERNITLLLQTTDEASSEAKAAAIEFCKTELAWSPKLLRYARLPVAQKAELAMYTMYQELASYYIRTMIEPTSQHLPLDFYRNWSMFD